MTKEPTDKVALPSKEQRVLFHVQKANKAAKIAFWWMKNINADDIDNLGVMSKIQNAIELLREVDNLTMDITITLSSSSHDALYQ